MSFKAALRNSSYSRSGLALPSSMMLSGIDGGAAGGSVDPVLGSVDGSVDGSVGSVVVGAGAAQSDSLARRR